MYSVDTKILTKYTKMHSVDTKMLTKYTKIYRVDMKEIILAKVFYPYFGIALCCILGLKEMSVKFSEVIYLFS